MNLSSIVCHTVYFYIYNDKNLHGAVKKSFSTPHKNKTTTKATQKQLTLFCFGVLTYRVRWGVDGVDGVVEGVERQRGALLHSSIHPPANFPSSPHWREFMQWRRRPIDSSPMKVAVARVWWGVDGVVEPSVLASWVLLHSLLSIRLPLGIVASARNLRSWPCGILR